MLGMAFGFESLIVEVKNASWYEPKILTVANNIGRPSTVRLLKKKLQPAVVLVMRCGCPEKNDIDT